MSLIFGDYSLTNGTSANSELDNCPGISHIEFGEGHLPVQVTLSEGILLRALSAPFGLPRLALQLGKDYPELRHPRAVLDAFESLRDKLGGTPIDNRLIRIGTSTIWYSMLDEDSDDARLAFIDSGLGVVEQTTRKWELRKLRKRREPFIEFRDQLLDPESSIERVSVSKKAWGTGAVVVAVSVGAASTYFILSRRTE